MATSTRTDPLRNFKFQVQIVPSGALQTFTPNIGKLGFSTMSGLSVTNDLLAYREGGMNTHTHKMVGLSDFSAVSFVRGAFAKGNELWKWQQFIHAWESGIPGGSTGIDSTTDYRCDIVVRVYDHPTTSDSYTYSNGEALYNNNVTGKGPGNCRLAMKLFRCWPGVFSLGGLSAGDSGLLVQELTVHHEGFVLAWNEEEASKYHIPNFN
jgi:phage tail-like protein